MRALVQRVGRASVSVAGARGPVSEIGPGLLVFLGVMRGDTDEDLRYMVRKVSGLRIFQDGMGRMNLSVEEAGGAVLVVSQFTLAADVRKGNRPSFVDAEAPGVARETYERFMEMMGEGGLMVRGGVFAAHMEVSLVNDGPVTIMLDSRDRGTV